MKLTIAIIIFLAALFLELVFVPQSLGLFLPVSGWLAAAVFATFAPRQVLGFALAAGFLKTLFLPSLGVFIFFTFAGSALAVLLVRSFLDGGGFIYDFAAVAAAVLSFEILSPLLSVFSGFFGLYDLMPSATYFTATFPHEILSSAAFVLLAGLVLYLWLARQHIIQSRYV